jgi:hypothetical protein
MNPYVRKTQQDLTKLQFALPSLEWIIAVISEDKSRYPVREVIPKQRLFSNEYVNWYRGSNADSCHIYGRPRSTRYVLLDLDKDGQSKLDQVRSDNFTPTAVIETSPDNFHVWIAVSDVDLPIPIATTLSKLICKRYGGDVGSTDALHVGRLPGLRNKKPQYRTSPGDGGPLATLRTARHAPIIPDEISTLLREAVSLVENEDALPLPSTLGACAPISNTPTNADIDPSRSIMTPEEAQDIYADELQYQLRRQGTNSPIQNDRSLADLCIANGLRIRNAFDRDEVACVISWGSEKARERGMKYVQQIVLAAFGEK